MGRQIDIQIRPDSEGYTGRECPQCEGYFKIKFGTGLPGDPGYTCPYCGHHSNHDHFWTQDQIKYVQSYALNHAMKQILGTLKQYEFDHKPPRRGFGIGVSFKVKGRPTPIRFYQEQQLETQVVCDNCTLDYAVYGVFGFCPDCGTHNSQQILFKSFDVVEKMLGMIPDMDDDVAQQMLYDSLENVVSSFDAFGRALSETYSVHASDPSRVQQLSFQNLTGARKNVQKLFGVDIAEPLTTEEWEFAYRCFQKRHLLSHKMGVVDEEYVNKTNDRTAVAGRKVSVHTTEVVELIRLTRVISTHMVAEISR